MRARPGLAAAAVLALLTLGWPASPSAHAVQTDEIGVRIAHSVVEVHLRSVGGSARRGGRTLVVRNRSDRPRNLRFRYVSASPTPRFNVKAKVRTLRGVTEGSLNSAEGLVTRVPPLDVASIAITVTARRNAPPEALGGRLVIVSERARRPVATGRPLVVGLRGARAEERQVRVSPKEVSLPVTLNQPTLGNGLGVESQDQGKAYVDLRGPGAAAFTGLGRKIDVVLRRDDGLSIRVPVAVEKAKKGAPTPDNVARLVIPSADVQFERPGHYEGDLPLGPGRSAPHINLTVNVHEWWGLAIAAVLLGVLMGRVVPPLVKLERVRRKGRGAIADAVRRYVKLRRGRGEPASYDLDALISPVRWERRSLFAQPRDEATRLLQEIQDGQTDPEVTAGVTSALNLRTRVERWARMEQSAGRLLDTLREARKSTREDAGPFVDTPLYRDATRVLSALQSNPPFATTEGEDAERKIGKLCVMADRERDVLQCALRVWELQAQLEPESRGLPNRAHVKRRRWDVKKVWETLAPKPPRRRTNEDFMELKTEFDIALRHLEKLDSDFPPPVFPGSRRAVWLRRLLARLRHAFLTGVARMAGGVWGAIVACARWVARLVAAWMSRLRGWTTVVEWFSLFLKLALPSLIYILTLYNDTWGSPSDFLTAFAAGFGGKVLIDLGVSGYHATSTPQSADAEQAEPVQPQAQPTGS